MIITMTDKQAKFALETWKTAIQVQQHFNTIELQIRSIAITVLTATLGAAGLVFNQIQETIREAIKSSQTAPAINSIYILGLGFSAADMLVLCGLIAWAAFYIMDRWWYHRLLQGAVNNAQKVEDAFKETPYADFMSLSNEIRTESHIKIFKRQIGSNTKVDLFYGILSIVLVLIIAFVF